MDKQTTFGFILIMVVLLVWMWLQAPPPPAQQTHQSDTVQQVPVAPKDSVAVTQPATTYRKAQAPAGPESLGKYFAHLATGTEKILIVKTDLYTAEITTRGGLIKRWELHKYLTWDKKPVQLVDFDSGGDWSLLFTTSDGKLVDTRTLYFDADLPSWKTVNLKDGETYAVELALPVEEGKRIVKRLQFTNDRYDVQTEIRFVNMQDVVSNFEYQVTWEHGLRYAEQNSIDESSVAMAYAYAGGEKIEVDASKPKEISKRDISGAASWVATTTKYFAMAMLPEEGKSEGAYLEGYQEPLPDKGVKEIYSLALTMPFKGGSDESAKFTLYLGPLDYRTIKSYDRGLDQMMSLGAAWVIRPIAEYILLPLFQFIHLLIPNYGLVIIVFSIIIKLALHPLTKTSMKSMRKMQALQPMMSELREKYKDDPQKMNQAVMNLYKEYGINPAAGCLPLLLQMPILFALWAMLRSTIGLRQASFAWWIQDLSIPDTIVTLPFTIPFVGISQLSGLALAMSATTFIQQKMTTTDPRQKAMVWAMPVMLLLVFNNLPSGLNLYYFVFNVLSIGQQIWMNKQHKDEPLRKVESKKRGGGIMARITKDMPNLKKG
jgi:YidC/Oxa1 family membrane protein insertase